jgi:hypothetical protein
MRSDPYSHGSVERGTGMVRWVLVGIMRIRILIMRIRVLIRVLIMQISVLIRVLAWCGGYWWGLC